MTLNDLFIIYREIPEYCGVELDSVERKTIFGNYPINVAAARGIVQEMDVLLSNGANVNSRGEHGYQPLHDATEQGHIEAVIWLLNNGADVIAETDMGMTAVDLAAALNYDEIKSMFISRMKTKDT